MLDEGSFSSSHEAEIAALKAELASRDITISQRDATISELNQTLEAERKETALRIAKMQAKIDKLTRKMFGRSSEKLEQLVLFIEDLEGDEGVAQAGQPDPDAQEPQARERTPPVRAFSQKLPRQTERREPASGNCCPDCGDTLRFIGDESDEMLDILTQAWQIIQTVRPKYGCRACDTVIQAPPPVKAIARGRMSFRTLSHILVTKWRYHIPFYRQAQMMEAQGVDMDRSTLARAAGYSATLLEPVAQRMQEIALTRSKIHVDDTHMPLLSKDTKGTRKAYLWTYVTDDTNSGSNEPPIAFYQFSTSRSGEVPQATLKDFTGYLQADAFAGFNRIYDKGSIKEVACLAHWRRKITDEHASLATELTRTTLAYFQKIYKIEEEIRGHSPGERLAVRRSRTRPVMRAMRKYLKAQLTSMSSRSDMATAIRYGLSRWQAMTRFLFNGTLEPDNLIAERSIRGFTVGRRNWLFAGSEDGGKRAATTLTIIETCLCRARHKQVYAGRRTMPSERIFSNVYHDLTVAGSA